MFRGFPTCGLMITESGEIFLAAWLIGHQLVRELGKVELGRWCTNDGVRCRNGQRG